jgi:hypothetical protein
VKKALDDVVPVGEDGRWLAPLTGTENAMSRLTGSGGVLLLVAWLAVGRVCADEPSPAAAELRAAGVEPTRQGLEAFLEPMLLTPQREARVRALLADLGSEDFQTRRKASAALADLPHLPRALLEGAPGQEDLEVARRVAELLEAPERDECERKVGLALRVIEEERVRGLAPLLLRLLPQWPEHLRDAAARAVTAGAGRGDTEVLRAALDPARPGVVRAAAATALSAALGGDADADLEGLLADRDPAVSLAASVALLNRGSRKPLTALTRLLDADQAGTRLAAAIILTEATGQPIEFGAFDEPKQRAAAAAAWRDWVERHGADAELHLPVGVRPAFRNRVVVAVWGEKVVREIDLGTGKTVFEAKEGWTYPWGAHATPDGHRLAVDHQRSFVVEYDQAGKEVWRRDVPGNPTGVQRLPDGRTLVASPNSGGVFEIDRSGKVVWEVALSGSPTTATRLPDGTTMVSLQNAGKVVAVDRRGKVVWEVGGMDTPHTVQMLPNGHLLTCEFGGGGVIKEYERSGKVVWQLKGVDNPAQAQRLPDGRTLVSGTAGLMEYDAKGKLLRHFKMNRLRFFAY